MSVTMKDLGIDRLSADDRLDLMHEIWDSLNAEPVRRPISDEFRRELERRVAEHRANPKDAVPWEQVRAEALARFER